MGEEQRRDKRISAHLQAELFLREGVDGPIVAGPVRASLNNVSLYGARFTVRQITIGDFHLFYSCHDNPSLIIFLEIKDPPESDEVFSIPLRPVWFDRLLLDELREKPFQLGGEFLIGPASDQVVRLKKMVSQTKQAEKGLFSKFFQGFLTNHHNSGG